MGWQWHQLNHMQAICTSLQEITTPAPHHSEFYGPDALPDAHKQRQSTDGILLLLLLLLQYYYYYKYLHCFIVARLCLQHFFKTHLTYTRIINVIITRFWDHPCDTSVLQSVSISIRWIISQDPNVDNSRVAILNTIVSKCKKQIQALLVTAAIHQWLLIVSVYVALTVREASLNLMCHWIGNQWSSRKM